MRDRFQLVPPQFQQQDSQFNKTTYEFNSNPHRFQQEDTLIQQCILSFTSATPKFQPQKIAARIEAAIQ